MNKKSSANRVAPGSASGTVPRGQNPGKRARGRRRGKAKRMVRREQVERLGIDTTQTSYLGKVDSVVANREFIFDVLSSTSFSVQTIDMNPGLSTSFPWLSVQAKGWEKYRFEEFRVEYVPRVSAFADNGKSGIVAIQFDYDATDSPPENKSEMLASRPNVDDLPCKSMQLSISASEMNKKGADSRYIRAGRQPPQTDLKWYDVGKLYVGTEGQATAGGKIGEIHFSYRVRFETPQIETTELEDPRDMFFAYSAASNEACQNMTLSSQDTIQWTGSIINTLGVTLVSDGEFSASAIKPNATGNYWVELDVNIFLTDEDLDDKFIQDVYIIPEKNGAAVVPFPGNRWEPGYLQHISGTGNFPSATLWSGFQQFHIHQSFLMQITDDDDEFGFRVGGFATDVSDASEVNVGCAAQICVTPI